MKIYILNHYDRWEDMIDVIGYFTSHDKAIEYMDAYINRYNCFEEKDFSISIEELDPDCSWMKE